jgi:hypothetical protein
MNESVNIIVYVAFIAFIMYYKSNVVELFTSDRKEYDYRDYLCETRKGCNSIVNLNERSLSMNPGNLRDKVFYDF